MDSEEQTARSREVWGTGDYGPTSRQLAPASEQLADVLGVVHADRALDVAAGHGNWAVAAARRGAAVVASDFSPVMLAAGQARTAAAGLDVTWREADAAGLPFADNTFDVTASVFGAIFAPQQAEVGAEIVRVTVPGGRFGLTAWTPDGLIARMFSAGAPERPPDPDAPDPLQWGDVEHVGRLFADLPCDVEFAERRLRFRHPSWDAWRRDIEAHGMMVVARQTMPTDSYDRMLAEMRTVLEEAATVDADGLTYEVDYLEITGRVDT